MPTVKVKFGAKFQKLWRGHWSLGCGISHSFEETYLYINFIKFTFIIGKICVDIEEPKE